MRTLRSSQLLIRTAFGAAKQVCPRRLRASSKRNPRWNHIVPFCGAMILSTFMLTACETDSWFDPSRTGYFERTPTTMPVLTRLDVVEHDTTTWTKASPPTADDLQPGELQYQLSAGDDVRIEVFELVAQGQTDVAVRTVDPSGNIRLPTIGEIPAAGLTIAQLQREVEERVRGYLPDPIVSVVLERGQGFNFVIYGAVSNTGVYGLGRPDFRLMDALALAGGTLSTTEKVYVIRSASLDPSTEPSYGNRGLGKPSTGPTAPTEPGTKPIDIDELINKLPESGTGAKPVDVPPPTTPPSSDPPKPSPGTTGQDEKPPVDVDDLRRASANPAVPAATNPTGEGWVWDAAKQQWQQSTTGAGTSAVAPAGPSGAGASAVPTLYATRVIEVNYQDLARGESNFNVVIRPGDRVFVSPPATGVVYIGGEINRSGVYELPQTGGKLTLSRLVDAAGGLSQIAIPSRVDLIRTVGPNREAAIRVNLAAIRNRAEPDIIMKADDHVIIGTNFFAVPLAAIRNGFRMTYGFGFLLDRNFGNDVFGPPPESVGVNR